MLPAAKEEMPSAFASSGEWSDEKIFPFAAGVSFIALGTHRGARAAQGKKPHQGFFSKLPVVRVGKIWAKWPGTHQDSERWWRKTASGSALDANGNILTDPQGRSFTWDFENRLLSVLVPGQNSGTTSFHYDPFGRRIQKSAPLGTTNYVYDGFGFASNVIEEVDNSSNVLARYTRTENLDEPLGQLRSATTSYYQLDGLSSVTSLSDGSGALAKTYSFDSFGQLNSASGTLVNPFQFTSRDFDSETGLYFNRSRYFDPSIGRFISEDPIGFLGSGSNFYAYVGNNPVNLTDPSGLAHCIFSLHGLAGC